MRIFPKLFINLLLVTFPPCFTSIIDYLNLLLKTIITNFREDKKTLEDILKNSFPLLKI